MKVVRHTSTLLEIEQLPTTATRAYYAVSCALAIGFLIVVTILDRGLPWYGTTIALLYPIWSFYLTFRATTSIVCTFDKKLNLLILKQKSWLGTKTSQHYLDEIQSVRFKAFENGQDESDGYEIGITLVTGSYVRLNEPSTSLDRTNIESIVEAIDSFLNLHSPSI